MSNILELMKAERDRLDRAIAILEGGANYAGRRGGGRRVLSAEARANIIKAQKARWAKWRKEQKKNEA